MKRIRLVSKKSFTRYALVDDEDFERLKGFSWRFKEKGNGSSGGYAARYVGRKRFFMHHAVVGRPKKGDDVDHVNGNGLDNRKSNLLIRPHFLNNLNRKNVSGVHFVKRLNKWRARISVRGKKISLGCHKTKKAAIAAYRKTLTAILDGRLCSHQEESHG